MCQLPGATRPLYIVVFSLDTTAALRHNPRQHLSVIRGNSGTAKGLAAKAARPLREKRYAVSARLHRAMYQSAVRGTRPLAARGRYAALRPRRPLPLLRRFAAQCAAAARPAVPHAPAAADGAAAAAPPASLTASRSAGKIKSRRKTLGFERVPDLSLIWISALDQTLLDHLFIAEPEVGDVRGTEAENILQCAAHFAQPEVNSDALQQLY